MTNKISFGKDNFIDLIDFNDKTVIKIHECDVMSPIVDMKTEYINELKNINKHVHILYSGGNDSEIIVESAIAADIEFTVHVLELYFEGKLMNGYDIGFAYEYCMLHGISPVIHKSRLEDFLETGKFIEYGVKYKCDSPQLCYHLWLIDQIDGFCIVGGDPLSILIDDETDTPMLHYRINRQLTYDRYFVANGKPGIGSMASYSFRIMLASLRSQINVLSDAGLCSKVQNSTPWWVNPYDKDNYIAKTRLYQNSGFLCEQKPDKYTGFEKIRYRYSDKYNEEGAITEFNKRFRWPLEKLVNMDNSGEKVVTSYPTTFRTLLNEFGEHYGTTYEQSTLV